MKAISRISKCFEELPNPRQDNAKRRIFLAILIIALRTAICEADGWHEVGLFGKSKMKNGSKNALPQLICDYPIFCSFRNCRDLFLPYEIMNISPQRWEFVEVY